MLLGEEAVKNALTCIHKNTIVLTLQNGWGNFDFISKLVNPDQVMIGVNYLSGTTITPGHVRQVGSPVAFIGRYGKDADDQVKIIGGMLDAAEIKTTISHSILNEVFKNLALNAATLPTAALLKLEAHKLVENEGTLLVMSDILEEIVKVIEENGIKIDFEERKAYIYNILKNAVEAKGSMLQGGSQKED